jgi:hypothetical protein
MRHRALFHWSPSDRRKQIIRNGLTPGAKPTIGSIPSVHDGHQVVCLATDPLVGWSLSGAMPWARKMGVDWDLWQVRLDDNDMTFVRAEFGGRIQEVRVGNRIPKSRVTYLGTRPSGKR